MIVYVVTYNTKYGIRMDAFDSEEKAKTHIAELESDPQFDEDDDFIDLSDCEVQ